MYKLLKHNYFLLSLIICLSIFLRFYGLTEKGICNSDAAVYTLEGRWFYSIIKSLKYMDFSKIKEQVEGLPLRHAKPTHSLFVALFGFLTGGVKDYTASYEAAAFGCLTILLTFFFAKALYNEKVALLSSLLLSIMPYHLIYSREGMAESISLFFLLLCAFFNVKSKKDKKFAYFIISSLSAGIAGTCNRRYIPILLLYMLFSNIKNAKKILLFLLLFPLPFITWQIPYHKASLFYKKEGCVLPFDTYLERLLLKSKASAHMVKRMIKEEQRKDFIPMVYCLFINAGKLATLPILFSSLFFVLLYVLRRRCIFSDFHAVFLILLPFAFFSLFATDRFCPRYLSPSLSAMCIGASVFLSALSKKIFFPLFSLIILFCAVEDMAILKLKSGYKEVRDYLLKNFGTPKHIAIRGWRSNIYCKFEDVETLASIRRGRETLLSLKKKGYNVILIDVDKYLVDREEQREILEYVEKNTSPIFVAKDNRAESFWYWAEEMDRKWSLLFLYKKKRKETGIKIYNLKHL
jgi:4-amino-4-deoxy-L-arabinose transferase-like glycosyltransferase